MARRARELTNAELFEDYEYSYDENGEPIWGFHVSEHARFFIPPPKGWRPPPPEVPDNPRDMLPDLWGFGRLVFEEIHRLWGSAADLMAKHWLFGRDAQLCRDWVRNLEHLVRAILLVAALTLDVVLPRPRAQTRRAVAPDAAPRPRQMKADDPSTWAVSLRMFPWAREQEDRPRRRERKPARNYLEAAPLALRIEALYRVLKHQDKHVARLARRMARLKEKNRRANEPRTLRLRPWTYPFSFFTRTSGQHAVQEKMTPAHFVASKLLAAWHDLSPG